MSFPDDHLDIKNKEDIIIELLEKILQELKKS